MCCQEPHFCHYVTRDLSPLCHLQISKPLEIQALDKEQRNQILLSLLDLGAGLRQLSRLTGVTYGVINKLSKRR